MTSAWKAPSAMWASACLGGGLLEFTGVEQRPGGGDLVVLGARLGVAGVQPGPVLLQRGRLVEVVAVVVGESGPFRHDVSPSEVRRGCSCPPARADALSVRA